MDEDSNHARRRVQSLVVASFDEYRDTTSLVPREPEVIRAGKIGGLPFDSLTTDLAGGCLPARHVCYGNCFAARAAFEAGIDFGTRVRNMIEPDVLRGDLAALPASQGYLRNGWNSDPSWEWQLALELSDEVVASGHHMVFITKCFRKPDAHTMDALASLRVELRVSISAFDSDSQLRMRTEVVEAYRAAGGVAIPQLMSASFAAETLNRSQAQIVDYFRANDFPVSENSLRFAADSTVLPAIDLTTCGRVSSNGDYWSGRLFTSLSIPTLTTLPPWYRGLSSGFRSKIGSDELANLWYDPVPTHDEVMSGVFDKPTQCGVAAELLPAHSLTGTSGATDSAK
jgi:hypothetical protein